MPIYVKDDSGWQELTGLDRPHVNVADVWRPVKNVYANVAGTWQETFAYFETSGGTTYSAGSGYAGLEFPFGGGLTVLNGSKTVELVLIGAYGGMGGSVVQSGSTLAYGGGQAEGSYTYVPSLTLNTGDIVSISLGAPGTMASNTSFPTTGFPQSRTAASGGTGGTTTVAVYKSGALFATYTAAGGGGGTGGSFYQPQRGFTGAQGGTGGSVVVGSTTYTGAAGVSNSGANINTTPTWGGRGAGNAGNGTGYVYSSGSSPIATVMGRQMYGPNVSIRWPI